MLKRWYNVVMLRGSSSHSLVRHYDIKSGLNDNVVIEQDFHI